VSDLIDLMDLREAAGTIVADYSAGMTKKVALACALVHAPRLLVLDEPFESVDPVSAANIEDVLRSYTASGGTVIVSSHSMDLVQRMCDHVAVIAAGRVLAAGTVDEVRGDQSLQDRFVALVGGRHTSEGPRGCDSPEAPLPHPRQHARAPPLAARRVLLRHSGACPRSRSSGRIGRTRRRG
jgi:ABC-2 type transport system ATP-binding protein